jgi:hypothetical protein
VSRRGSSRGFFQRKTSPRSETPRRAASQRQFAFSVRPEAIRPAGNPVLETPLDWDQGVKKPSHKLKRVDTEKSPELRRFLIFYFIS